MINRTKKLGAYAAPARISAYTSCQKRHGLAQVPAPDPLCRPRPIRNRRSHGEDGQRRSITQAKGTELTQDRVGRASCQVELDHVAVGLPGPRREYHHIPKADSPVRSPTTRSVSSCGHTKCTSNMPAA
jgi:hypothetical protein